MNFPSDEEFQTLTEQGLQPLNPYPGRMVPSDCQKIPKRGEWLTDMDISMFVDHLLVAKYVEKSEPAFYKPEEIGVLSTLTLESLREGRKCSGLIKNQRLIEKNLILIPVHQPKAQHWKLTVIYNLKDGLEEAQKSEEGWVRIYEHDSVGKSFDGEMFGECEEGELWERFIVSMTELEEVNNELQITFIKTKSPAQDDSWSCGFRTLNLISKILTKGYERAREEERINRKRPKMEVMEEVLAEVQGRLKRVLEEQME